MKSPTIINPKKSLEWQPVVRLLVDKEEFRCKGEYAKGKDTIYEYIDRCNSKLFAKVNPLLKAHENLFICVVCDRAYKFERDVSVR